MRTYVGDANTPFSAEALRSASDDFIAYVGSPAGKEEIKSLTHDLDRIGKELKPMLTTLHEAIRVYGRKDSEPTKDGVRHSAELLDVLSVIEKIERLESAGKIQGGVVQSDNEKEREVFDKLERELGDCTRTMASTIGKRMSAVDSHGRSTFDNMEVKEDESVTDVCIDVIKSHAIELGISAALEYGFFVGGFKNRLAEAFTNGTEMQVRMKNVGPVLAERNRKLAPGERLSGQEMATLSRATSTFLVPSPRPDAEKDWGSNAGKRAEMLTAISYNISRATSAMNLKEGEKLSDVALRHAVLNMGLVDGKLVESIASLSDDDYNALLAEAGQMDAKDGVYGVSSAVSALRGAQAILNQIEIVEDDE